MKELKMYAIKATKKPTKSTTLLSTVQVVNEAKELGYCYISFSDKLVEAVGKKLPRGISDQDPALLFVLYIGGEWCIWASYVVGGIPDPCGGPQISPPGSGSIN